MPSDVKLHFSVVPEAFAADVTLEGGLASVEPHVNLEPVPVGVLAGTVATHQRSFHLTKETKNMSINSCMCPNSGKWQSFKFVETFLPPNVA